jgi:hypothetical protein
VYWVNDFLSLKGTGREVRKVDAFKIQEWVMKQYNEHGRLSSITDEELEEQVKIHLPDLYAESKER